MSWAGTAPPDKGGREAQKHTARKTHTRSPLQGAGKAVVTKSKRREQKNQASGSSDKNVEPETKMLSLVNRALYILAAGSESRR